MPFLLAGAFSPCQLDNGYHEFRWTGNDDDNYKSDDVDDDDDCDVDDDDDVDVDDDGDVDGDDDGDVDLCSPTKLGDSNEHSKREAAKKHLVKRKEL